MQCVSSTLHAALTMTFRQRAPTLIRILMTGLTFLPFKPSPILPTPVIRFSFGARFSIILQLPPAPATTGIAGGMTGGAAATHLATVMHRMGIPQQQLDRLHSEIEQGHYVLLLRQMTAEIPGWKSLLQSSSPRMLIELPYTGIKDVI